MTSTNEPAWTSRLPDMHNPVTRDRLWFVRLPSAPDDPVVFECELPAGSPGTPLHMHTRTVERFECIDGELSMVAGDAGRILRLAPGGHVDVPSRTPHRFWNATSAPVRFRSTVTPGLEFERFLRSVYALGIAGRVGAEGMPRSPLQLAVLRELSDLYFVGPPLLVQRAAFGALSAIASLVGTRNRMERLSHTPSSVARRIL